MRLALYLRTIGVEPNLTGHTYREYLTNLVRQFQALEDDQRREARKHGRKLINACGFDRATEGLVPIPPNKMKYEQFRNKRLQRIKYWPNDTPPCPYFRFKRFNLPKKSWTSREAAEHELAKHKGSRLVIYPCPVQRGYWHLGHPKQPKQSKKNTHSKGPCNRTE